MSPKFHTNSLNHHLPSRIGSVLLLVSLLLYVVAMVVPVLVGTEGLTVLHWPKTIACMLLLSVFGAPAARYAWRGAAGPQAASELNNKG